MEEEAQRIDPVRAELPEFSVDWRFLLPIRPQTRILVLSDSWQDLAVYFAGLEMQVIHCRMDGSRGLPGAPHEGGQFDRRGGPGVVAHLLQIPFAAGSFDAVVIPLGIPAQLLGSITGADRLAELKRLLRPGGTLLIGFSNHWGLLRRGRRMGIAVTPASIRRRIQEAGFQVLSLHGVVPNLDRPAYILPLRKGPLQYFLRHRFLGRPGRVLLRLLPAALIWRLVRGLLPSYFLRAGV